MNYWKILNNIIAGGLDLVEYDQNRSARIR